MQAMNEIPALWESKKRAKRGPATWAATSQERRRIHRAFKKKLRTMADRLARRDEGGAK